MFAPPAAWLSVLLSSPCPLAWPFSAFSFGAAPCLARLTCAALTVREPGFACVPVSPVASLRFDATAACAVFSFPASEHSAHGFEQRQRCRQPFL